MTYFINIVVMLCCIVFGLAEMAMNDKNKALVVEQDQVIRQHVIRQAELSKTINDLANERNVLKSQLDSQASQIGSVNTLATQLAESNAKVATLENDLQHVRNELESKKLVARVKRWF
jgi:hypothetical protein